MHGVFTAVDWHEPVKVAKLPLVSPAEKSQAVISQFCLPGYFERGGARLAVERLASSPEQHKPSYTLLAHQRMSPRALSPLPSAPFHICTRHTVSLSAWLPHPNHNSGQVTMAESFLFTHRPAPTPHLTITRHKSVQSLQQIPNSPLTLSPRTVGLDRRLTHELSTSTRRGSRTYSSFPRSRCPTLRTVKHSSRYNGAITKTKIVGCTSYV